MDCDQGRPQRSNWRGGCVITTEGVRLDARKNGQIAGSAVVRDRWNAGSTAQPTYGLPGNPAVCYRPTRSRVHLGNVGQDLRIGPHKLDIRFWRDGEDTKFRV